MAWPGAGRPPRREACGSDRGRPADHGNRGNGSDDDARDLPPGRPHRALLLREFRQSRGVARRTPRPRRSGREGHPAQGSRDGSRRSGRTRPPRREGVHRLHRPGPAAGTHHVRRVAIGAGIGPARRPTRHRVHHSHDGGTDNAGCRRRTPPRRRQHPAERDCPVRGDRLSVPALAHRQPEDLAEADRRAHRTHHRGSCAGEQHPPRRARREPAVAASLPGPRRPPRRSPRA